ncbi:phosphonate ABC transporter, permease protein PhnE [Halalkalibacter sp. APA_J-10(15)]|uniref:phosphonate ABC transporter, permease protein PhnE n=1 Tax=Halalkalibacter sp. APA_J-10(15) TaxID=2933805 RepID=UPI001FF55255|nr:phosphonate ABC transporter, permease protein PhnE [Halalkalibacter sp. APA_J-10(15)]MCK0470231.1 phosphonate ABC transporter, permease protein PhnE [Halalkalibacter sp. APA_J-10(15)]
MRGDIVVHKELNKTSQREKKNRFMRIVLIGAILFFFFSLYQLSIDYGRLFSGVWTFLQTLTIMVPPDFTYWREVLAAALESLQVAIVGCVLAIIIGFGLAFPAADNLTPHRTISWLLKGFASLVRAIPTLIWALIFIVAVGMGPFPGILAIMIGSIGMLIKVFAQSIEEVEHGVIEAMQATGANWFAVVIQGVIPTVMTALLAWCIMRFEGDIAESTILGAVGAGGIGWELMHAMRLYRFDQAFFVALVIFVMVFSVEFVSNRLKMKLKHT